MGLAAALILILALGAPGQARASQIELSANQIYNTWTNLNGALVVVAASTAIDDDWTAKFKAMAPTPAKGKTLADVIDQANQFRKKLNAVLAANGLDPVNAVSAAGRAPDSPPSVFLNSGVLMDNLILLLNKLDPLAFIAQYYSWTEVTGKSPDDVYAMAALANRRMDVYMKENDIAPPADSAQAGETDGAKTGKGS